MAAVTKEEHEILKDMVNNMNDLIISFKAEVLSAMEKNDAQQNTFKEHIDEDFFESAQQRAALATSYFDKLGEVNIKVTYFEQDLESKEQKINEMKQNIDNEMGKIDGQLFASTSEAKAQCREFIRDNNRAIQDRLDKVDKLENTITEISEHFEQNKNNKDKVDKEIQDIKDSMVKFTFESTITDYIDTQVKEHFEQNKDHKDKVNGNIAEIKN